MSLSFLTKPPARASKIQEPRYSPRNLVSGYENSEKELEKKMSRRINLLGITGIILAFGMIAFAQQPQTATPPEGTLKQDRLERREKLRGRLDGMRRRGGREGFAHRGPGAGNLLRGIDLTPAQREQIRAISQRRVESTKAQREELFRLREKRIAGTFSAEDEARAKALRQEIHAAMDGIRTETAGILTAEQRAKVEEFQKQRKGRHEERMKKHELRMKERQERRNKTQ
jgi:Spy/CpxP family protein refolding chaperone